MAPGESSSEDFSWAGVQENLSHVRSKLQENASDNGSLLRSAFTDAYRVANHCYDKLSEMGSNESLPVAALEDWRKFLVTFKKDAWSVYPDHSSVKIGETKDLLPMFDDIATTAENAHLALLDWHASNDPLPSRRKPVLQDVKKLIISLKAVLKELEPPRRAADVRHVKGGRKAGKPEGNPVSDQGDPVKDTPYAADTPSTTGSGESAPVRVGWRIAAGAPSTADESIDEVFPLPNRSIEEGELFWLKITGEILMDSFIVNGDWVAVSSAAAAEGGNVVAVSIDGETTVRASSEAGQATILGRVVAVLHRVR